MFSDSPEKTSSNIPVQEILRRTKEVFTQQRKVSPTYEQIGHLPNKGKEPGTVPRREIEEKKNLPVSPSSWDSLLLYSDGEFVRQAYLLVLAREPDPLGGGNFLRLLREGRMSRIEILGSLRYSPEGRRKKIRVDGLFWRFAMNLLYKIPVFGYWLKLAITLLRIPQTLKNIYNFELFARERISHGESYVSQLESRLEQASQGIQAIQKELINKAETSLLQTHRQMIEALQVEMGKMGQQMSSHKMNLLDQERRLSLILQEIRKRLAEPLSAGPLKKILAEDDHMLDFFYLSLEDRLRGTREEIKERQRVYLPYIQKAFSGIQEAPVLDVGCGRGEWLELLRENGWTAKGVDINRIMIQQCRDRGLEVLEADAMEYLKEQNDNSWGAVTGFQLVEHLPLKTLVALFDESRRILKPGGIIIFETPNPENLIVGACNFYLDPTHFHPIPPATLEFFAESRGFLNVEILRLHPMQTTVDNESIQRLFFGPLDYAVIAFKPRKEINLPNESFQDIL
jgi:SAM-dependent methyltransferase